MPPALHYRKADEQVEEIVLKGMPLGTFVDFPYQEQRFTLAPGDVLLLMSDGLLELFSPARDMLGEERIRACFHQAAGGEAREVIARLRELARAWMQEGMQNDDIALLVIKRKGGRSGVIRR